MARLRIAEIFTSIQGEGKLLGMPSDFIRVSGCNLRCGWCDTPYASWRPDGPVLEVAQVLERVEESSARHVVVTGGEPMLFDAVVELCNGLRDLGKHITIETAGTVMRSLPCDLMSISPKLRNSVPVGDRWEERHERLRWQPEVIGRLAGDCDVQLKFVLDPDFELESQYAEVDCMVGQVGIAPHDVLVMAQGVSAMETTAKEAKLVQGCLERGYRLTPRYHLHLFGNTRGT